MVWLETWNHNDSLGISCMYTSSPLQGRTNLHEIHTTTSTGALTVSHVSNKPSVRAGGRWHRLGLTAWTGGSVWPDVTGATDDSGCLSRRGQAKIKRAPAAAQSIHTRTCPRALLTFLQSVSRRVHFTCLRPVCHVRRWRAQASNCSSSSAFQLL